MKLLGWLFLNTLLYAASLSEFEYIFWGKIHTDNLILSSEEYHLSRAMQASADDSEYDFICSISPTNKVDFNHKISPENSQSLPTDKSAKPTSIQSARALLAKDQALFIALNEHKSELVKCAQAALIKEHLSIKNLSAKSKASLSLLPFRFKSELSPDNLILIYARKSP